MDSQVGANMGWIIAAIVAMGTFGGWFNKITIKAALAEFKEALRKEFMDADLIKAKLEPIQADLDALHMRVNAVEDYAHVNIHAMRNELHKLKLKAGID